MAHTVTRRDLLRATASSAALAFAPVRIAAGAPGGKLNIAVVGSAHRAAANLGGIRGENIVAICDVDANYLAAALKKHPGAKPFKDFRRMLDAVEKEIDAVVVSTPDHTHAVAAMRAIRAGKHCYCEKPLTRTVSEARAVTEAAARHKVVTQIGTQIHAGTNYRRTVELVRAGAIGPVAEVHVWVPASYKGTDRPKETPPVPKHLDWDLWLGPVPERPYHPCYHPGRWRSWWAFGTGALGDFGCHYMDLPFWALDLKHPTSVEAEGPPVHPEGTPAWLIARYAFPARGNQPPVRLTWYDGGKRPDALLKELLPPAPKRPTPKAGVLFVGTKGWLFADYGRHLLLPADRFKDYQRPKPTIPNSIGHHQEWIQACKTGGETTCRFSYSGPLTEAALLGTVAYRTGEKLAWDGPAGRVTNCPKAERYLRHAYRKGWSLETP